MLAWRRVDREVAAAIEGLSGPQLRAVADLWRRTGKELTARFGGSSMEPTIPAGAEVILRCGADPASGDIIAFVHGDQVVLHRLVGASKRREWVLTRGDAHSIPDQPLFDPEALIGVVVGVRKGHEFVAPAPPPRSLGRRLALSVCLAGLRLDPTLGPPLIRALRLVRRLVAPFARGS